MASDVTTPTVDNPISARHREVLLLLEAGGFVGMTARGPAPESFEHIFIHACKGPLGRPIPEVIGPTSQERVEFANELCLTVAKAGLNQLPDFDPQGFDLTLCYALF